MAFANFYQPASVQGAQVAASANQFLNNLGNRIGNEAEDDVSDELQSRVSQLRELRRMQHERELAMFKEQSETQREAMRQQSILARLEAQNPIKVIRLPGANFIYGP